MSSRFQDLIDKISSMPVKDLADLVKELEGHFGVSAAAPVALAPAAAGAAASVVEDKNEFKVTLKDSGANKIGVIKALRAVIQGLNLTDAKAKVEGAPVVISEAAPKDEAKKIKEALEAAGAKVELA